MTFSAFIWFAPVRCILPTTGRQATAYGFAVTSHSSQRQPQRQGLGLRIAANVEQRGNGKISTAFSEEGRHDIGDASSLTL